MFCNSGNLPSPVDTPQSQFKSRVEEERSDVGSHFGPTCSPEKEAVQNCHV